MKEENHSVNEMRDKKASANRTGMFPNAALDDLNDFLQRGRVLFHLKVAQ